MPRASRFSTFPPEIGTFEEERKYQAGILHWEMVVVRGGVDDDSVQCNWARIAQKGSGEERNVTHRESHKHRTYGDKVVALDSFLFVVHHHHHHHRRRLQRLWTYPERTPKG